MKSLSKNITLFSDRLNLREITPNDLSKIHELHSIPEVDEYNTLGVPKDIKDTKSLLDPIIRDQKGKIRKHYWFRIILKENDQFIGLSGINLSADRYKIGEIFYKLLPTYWGNGYATEVSKTLIKFGFESLKLHRIEAGVATEHIKSIRVLEKVSMKREGIRRKILPIRGVWKDNFHYAILEDDKRDY